MDNLGPLPKTNNRSKFLDRITDRNLRMARISLIVKATLRNSCDHVPPTFGHAIRNLVAFSDRYQTTVGQKTFRTLCTLFVPRS